MKKTPLTEPLRKYCLLSTTASRIAGAAFRAQLHEPRFSVTSGCPGSLGEHAMYCQHQPLHFQPREQGM